MAEKIFRPPKSLKKKKKLVRKNYIVEQTMNGFRCGKFTEPVPHGQNRPTQPRCNLQVTAPTSGKCISILYRRNPSGECGLFGTKLLEKGSVMTEITRPFETYGQTATIIHRVQMQVPPYRTVLIISDRVAYAASHHVERRNWYWEVYWLTITSSEEITYSF